MQHISAIAWMRRSWVWLIHLDRWEWIACQEAIEITKLRTCYQVQSDVQGIFSSFIKTHSINWKHMWQSIHMRRVYHCLPDWHAQCDFKVLLVPFLLDLRSERQNLLPSPLLDFIASFHSQQSTCVEMYEYRGYIRRLSQCFASCSLLTFSCCFIRYTAWYMIEHDFGTKWAAFYTLQQREVLPLVCLTPVPAFYNSFSHSTNLLHSIDCQIICCTTFVTNNSEHDLLWQILSMSCRDMLSASWRSNSFLFWRASLMQNNWNDWKQTLPYPLLLAAVLYSVTFK